jgi:hypothetical protein
MINKIIFYLNKLSWLKVKLINWILMEFLIKKLMWEKTMHTINSATSQLIVKLIIPNRTLGIMHWVNSDNQKSRIILPITNPNLLGVWKYKLNLKVYSSWLIIINKESNKKKLLLIL